MPYKKILSRAWEIVKQNKPLWVLGLILAVFGGGGGSGSFNFEFGGSSDYTEVTPETQEQVSEFGQFIVDLIKQVPIWVWILLILGILVVGLMMLIISIVIKNWAEGSLIGMVNDAEEGKEISLASGSRHGRRGMKSLIWLALVPWLICGIVFLVCLIPLVGLLIVAPLILKILLGMTLGLVLVLGFIVILIALNLTLILAQRIVIIENLPAQESFKKAFYLMKKHLFEEIGMGMINLGIGCVFNCLSVIVLLIVLGIVVLGFIINPWIGIIFLAPAFIAAFIWILARGIFEAFQSATWTLFYREIKAVKTEDSNES